MDSTLTLSVQPELKPHSIASSEIVEPLTEPLTIELLERIRLILRGGSIVDWFRLSFENREEVQRFLRVNGYDIRLARDLQRLRFMIERAATYLRNELDLLVHEYFRDSDDVVSLFLAASYRGSDIDLQARQRVACILLKVVHTINHFEARELRLNLPLRTVELFEVVEEQVMGHLNEMVATGFPISQHVSSRKSGRSTITKLLSKRRANATEILDRLRFRVIVEQIDDIPRVLAEMTQRFIPYNYVVPEESSNNILRFSEYLDRHEELRSLKKQLQFAINLESQAALSPVQNECSADEFRMINFVADIPVSVERVITRRHRAGVSQHGWLVYVAAEFQVFDQRTWEYNEQNSSASHEAYKGRQRQRVRTRLFDGLEALWSAQDD